ncbi:MAG: hypothetical protein ACXWVD_00395 [Telluria sp.]
MSLLYFGPPALRKEWEQQADTPVGALCMLCNETVAEGDIGNIDEAGNAMHYECQMRGVIGSVAHQEKRCSCYGGTEPDLPDGMTRRQAALAAVRLWEKNHYG